MEIFTIKFENINKYNLKFQNCCMAQKPTSEHIETGIKEKVNI